MSRFVEFAVAPIERAAVAPAGLGRFTRAASVLLAAILFAAAPVLAPAALAEDEEEEEIVDPDMVTGPQYIVLGLDLSQSNPLVTDVTYARRAADWVSQYLEDLEVRSIVRLRTFGIYDQTVNDLAIDRQISRGNRPEEVARLMTTIIAGVPQLIDDGTLEAQRQTNIIPFLLDMSEIVDCNMMPTRIILISDGVEDSEYANLRDPDDDLPRRRDLFEDCLELQIVGLGQGLGSPSETDRLRREWASWARYAGFQFFRGLSNW